MGDDAHTLDFGVTYDVVAARTASGRLLTLTAHRSHDRIPPHKHANDYVCLVLAGGFSEHEGRRSRERSSGCVFTHHAGEAHYDRFGSRGAVCVNLHSPEGEPGPDVEGMCSAPVRIAAEKLAFELAADSREELALASLAAEILGDLRPAKPRRPDRGAWIGRVVEAISDEPYRRWSLDEMSRIADHHPVRVAQSFRARTGMSLGAFQRLRRLTRLSLALRHGREPLAALAAEFGYCDQPHMTSEFRAAFGVSPGRYRRNLR
ncbi:MAG: helix-turn-helix transcriptional regulator [Alphaproteobacteria bacterium]|nr:helix-turn-helix transcriptional regulator [Alphaproteobacteria bacterium]